MFRLLFTVTGLFALALGGLLLVWPEAYLSLYVVKYGPDMPFAAQRLAPAVAGLGALLLLGRDLPPGAFAARFATLAALVWFGVAGTGLFHYANGMATGTILIAAVTEVILGLLFLVAGKAHRGA